MNKRFDAIIVLGGGLDGRGGIPAWPRARLEKALELVESADFLITTSAGTTHKPHPLGTDGFPVYESAAAANFLISRGVPAEKILTETVSLDTIGNAYFVRAIHTDPRGWKNLALITSAFHLPRTRSIFEFIFSLQPASVKYNFSFIESSDAAADPEILRERIQREAESLAAWEKTKAKIKSWAEFHQWLYTEHAAYALGKQLKKVDGKVLESY